MSSAAAPDGWPVVGAPPRLYLWLFAAVMTLMMAAGAFMLIAGLFPGPSPFWRPLVAVAGLTTIFGASAWGW